jgi:hypothetical protein
MYCMRPEPVVFRRMAFWPHWSALGGARGRGGGGRAVRRRRPEGRSRAPGRAGGVGMSGPCGRWGPDRCASSSGACAAGGADALFRCWQLAAPPAVHRVPWMARAAAGRRWQAAGGVAGPWRGQRGPAARTARPAPAAPACCNAPRLPWPTHWPPQRVLRTPRRRRARRAADRAGPRADATAAPAAAAAAALLSVAACAAAAALPRGGRGAARRLRAARARLPPLRRRRPAAPSAASATGSTLPCPVRTARGAAGRPRPLGEGSDRRSAGAPARPLAGPGPARAAPRPPCTRHSQERMRAAG